jgi:tRNA U55 pseudouridine synthase TruB
MDKEYIAEIDLSKNTDTYDREGKVTEEFVNKKEVIYSDKLKQFL